MHRYHPAKSYPIRCAICSQQVNNGIALYHHLRKHEKHGDIIMTKRTFGPFQKYHIWEWEYTDNNGEQK